MSKSMAALTQRPGFLISRVGTAIQAGFKEVLVRWEIKPLHFLLLTVLNDGQGVSQQELCRALAIDSGNMVELLDRLEELGLVRRRRDPSDRRRHIVTITPSGSRTLCHINAAVDAFDNSFLSPLTDAERRRLVRTLGKLYAATPEGRREAPPLGLSQHGTGG